MSDRGKAGRALAHSGIDDGDYIFINPRQVVRILKANKRFIWICVLAALCLSQIHNFFFYTPEYVSEVKLKIEPKSESLSIAPFLERFQNNEQLFTRTNAVLEEIQSNKFTNQLLMSYLQNKLPVSPIIPIKRREFLLRWLYSSMKKEHSYESLQKHMEWQELARYLAGSLESVANFDGGIITIKAKTIDPNISAQLASLAGSTLSERNYIKLKEKVYSLKDFVGRQTSERKKILEKLEDQRVRLQKRHETASTQDFKNDTYKRYNTTLSRLTTIGREKEVNNKIISQTEAELKKVKENLANPKLSNSELFLSQLQHRIELLQYQKALLDNDTAEQNEMKKLEIQEELTQVAETYQKAIQERDQAGGLAFVDPNEYYKNLEKSVIALRDERKKLETEESYLQGIIHVDKKEIAKLPDIILEFEDLQRQIQISSELYLGLQQKLQEVEIMEAGITNDLQLVSPAAPSNAPIGLPNKIRFIASGVVGLFLALLVLILKNTFIHTVRNFKELQNEGITVIGEVPIVAGLNAPIASFLGKNLDRMFGKNFDNITEKMTSLAPKMLKQVQDMAPNIVSRQIDRFVPKFGKIQKSLGLTQEKRASELIVIDKPNSSEADIFRYMRLRLSAFVSQKLPVHEKGKIILITSPTESSGKTFISTNLAASFGKGEIKTLLIDLDLRNSSVNRTFADFKEVPGIETAVATKTNLEDYIISVSKFFDVLLCRPGIENPTDVLESQTLRNFIEKMKDRYDYIFIDSPPVLATCDPSLIAPQCDLILMVAAFEITFREDVQLAIEGLNAGKNHPIVGVLNLVDSGFDRYGYGNASGNYYKAS